MRIHFLAQRRSPHTIPEIHAQATQTLSTNAALTARRDKLLVSYRRLAL